MGSLCPCSPRWGKEPRKHPGANHDTWWHICTQPDWDTVAGEGFEQTDRQTTVL